MTQIIFNSQEEFEDAVMEAFIAGYDQHAHDLDNDYSYRSFSMAKQYVKDLNLDKGN